MKSSLASICFAVLAAATVRAAVPGAPNPSWWGVVNSRLQVRFQNDGGVTKLYRVYVKYDGEPSFSKLSDTTCTGGTGGQIINPLFDGTRAATFRLCRVNDDGEGEMGDDLAFTDANERVGSLLSSAPYNDHADNAAANAADGRYDTSFNSQAESAPWIGFDLGSTRSVEGVRFIPRHDRTARMASATIQVAGQSDFSDAVAAATYSNPSLALGVHTVRFASPVVGRYVRWVAHSSDNMLAVSEIEFLSTACENIPEELTPADVTAMSANPFAGAPPVIGWTDMAHGDYPVQVLRATAAGGPYARVAGLSAGTTNWMDAAASVGIRYYYTLQYTNAVSAGSVSDWAACRRLRRLERDSADNTRLRTGVTVILSDDGNENNDTWKSANAFDGDTTTAVSCTVADTRIALDFGADKVGVELVRAHAAPDPRHGRLQTARLYATDGDFMTSGTQASDGGMPYAIEWALLPCSDPRCHGVYYLMRPDHQNFFSCMSELELYGWFASDEAAVLLAPTRLSKTVSASGVSLSWDSCNRAASYRVEKFAGGTWTSLGTTVAPAFADSSITMNGSSVSYRIVSIAEGGDEEAISQTFSFVPYVPANGTGLTAIYSRPYANATWSAAEEAVATTNVSERIDFDWQRTSPVPAWGADATAVYNVRCRWFGTLVIPYTGRYSFVADTHDGAGAAVAIDGKWVLNSVSTTAGGLSGALDLTAGPHDFYAEFHKPADIAKFVLKWGGAVAEEAIPASQFIPAAPFVYGDWTSVRTFGAVPQIGMVFPANGDGLRFNHGSKGHGDWATSYLAMSRDFKGDFDLSFHVALVSPDAPNGQRFGVKVASSAAPNAPGAFYFIGYSASDNGSGWTATARRDTAKSGYDRTTAWTRRGEFLRSGSGDVRVCRKDGNIVCYYRNPQTSAWGEDETIAAGFLPETALIQLFATGPNDQAADAIWEVSDVLLEKVKQPFVLVVR